MAEEVRQPAVLGIDVGTSGIKLLAVPVDGTAEPRVSRAGVRVRRAPDGTSEIDPAAWWRAVVRAARGLDLDGLRVVGVGTSTLFPALVALDARGRALRPAVLYDDARSGPQARDLARRPLTSPAVQHLLTGNRVRPGTISLSSLLWLRETEPEVYRQASLFGHAGTYLGHRLTGRFAIDATNASLTGLYAAASGEAWLRGVCAAGGLGPHELPRRLGRLTCRAYLDLLARGRPELRDSFLADLPPGVDAESLLAEHVALPERGWVAALLDAVGLAQARLPEIVWPTERLGELTEEAAEALGLDAGLPVAAGAGDTVCGCLGVGLEAADEVVALCGSTDCIAAVQRSAVFSTRTVNMAYLDEETWVAVAPMNATGSAVDWVARTLLGGGKRRFDRLFALAAEAEAGSGGVVFLPYLAGERSPVYDPDAKGIFFGLTLATGRPEMARAVLEGIGFGHRQILRHVDLRAGAPVRRVRAAGGGTAAPLLRRIRADAADRTYLYAGMTEVTALGAALLGGVAAGVWGTWQEAAAEARRRTDWEAVEPDPDAWHCLKRNYEVYTSLYGALEHCF